MVLVRSGNQKLMLCTASSCCWNDQKPEISAWDPIHTSEELHMPSWLFERETLRFFREKKGSLSSPQSFWLDGEVFVSSLHFILAFPLPAFISQPWPPGRCRNICDPVPEVSFCRVGINRGTPVGYYTLSKTHPGKPLPTLLPRQCPPHLIRMTLDRLHYDEKCTYAFTAQMGLLAFLEEKDKDEGVFIGVQQHLKICLAVLLGAWPQLWQHNPEQQRCLQHVKQIGGMLNSFTRRIMERCKSASPPTARAPSKEEKRAEREDKEDVRHDGPQK